MSDYRGLIEDIEKNRKKEAERQQDLSYERLVSFLYLMMRDEVPAGKVDNIITDVDDVDLDNQHLKSLAQDFAIRIREG